MNTRHIAEEFRLSHWAGIMRERQASGLSIKAFCKSSGFHENVYFYWQRRLREAACQGLIPQQAHTDTSRNEIISNDKALVPSGWAQLTEIEPAPAPMSSLTVEISGCRINVSTDTDSALLAKVCALLKSL